MDSDVRRKCRIVNCVYSRSVIVFALLERRKHGINSRSHERNRGNLTFSPNFFFSKQTDNHKKDLRQTQK